MRKHNKKLASLILFLATRFPRKKIARGEINIYSHRQPFLINPILDSFTSQTGIKTNVIHSKIGLAERLQAEGKNSPCDVILTVDIGRLNKYAISDLLQSIDSEELTQNIPEHLRSKNNTWFGLSKRHRVIVASKEKVPKNEIKRIEDLANPEWKGRICSRPGSHVYNRALMASLIAANGEKKAEEWAKGLVSNLARRPQGNDRAQVKAIHEGLCDVAIINNYYLKKLKNSKKEEQRNWAESVYLINPNQYDRGVHVNISGGGVAKYSKNREEAIKFLEFLSQKHAQELFYKINYEYPVNLNVEIKEDKVPLDEIAKLLKEAQKIIDKVRW